jgi:hypothetical protein
MILGTLEAFKAHRDLLVGFRETFARFDRASKASPLRGAIILLTFSLTPGLSPDPVEKLEKKVATTQTKVEVARKAKKPGFEAEVDRLVGTIEADQTAIEGWLARRGVIQAMCGTPCSFSEDRHGLMPPLPYPSNAAVCGTSCPASSTRASTLSSRSPSSASPKRRPSTRAAYLTSGAGSRRLSRTCRLSSSRPDGAGRTRPSLYLWFA